MISIFSLAYGGNIIQCFEEGTENIPGPVENFHATLVTKTSISLEWIPNEEDTNQTANAPKKTNDIDFVVQYGKVNNMTLYETVVKMENVNILIIFKCIIFHPWQNSRISSTRAQLVVDSILTNHFSMYTTLGSQYDRQRHWAYKPRE